MVFLLEYQFDIIVVSNYCIVNLSTCLSLNLLFGYFGNFPDPGILTIFCTNRKMPALPHILFTFMLITEFAVYRITLYISAR